MILLPFLILPTLFGFSIQALAQEFEIYYLPRQNAGVKPPPKRDLPLESWITGNQSIRGNLDLRMNTWPLMNKGKVQFELGPGQILIRIPI